MKSLKKIIGEEIKKYMKSNDLSQKEMLEQLNNKGCKISQTGLHFWIEGKKEPRENEREILFCCYE